MWKADVDLSSPIRTVIPSAHGAVLAALARTEQPLSGRALAALIGTRVGYRQVNQVLGELVAGGIALRDEHPPAYLYSLNRDHVAADAIMMLSRLRDRLLENMTTLVAGWRVAAAAVWLFGSAARGDGGPESDIDVFVLRHNTVDEDDATWQEQLTDVTRHVWRWTGNDCRVLEYSQTELDRLIVNDERIIDDLRRDAITVVGVPAVRATSRRVS